MKPHFQGVLDGLVGLGLDLPRKQTQGDDGGENDVRVGTQHDILRAVVTGTRG